MLDAHSWAVAEMLQQRVKDCDTTLALVASTSRSMLSTPSSKYMLLMLELAILMVLASNYRPCYFDSS